MSASPNENYEILVDELREIQQKLYKEATFEDYVEKELQDVTSKLELQIQKAKFLQKYVIFFSSNSHKIASNFSSLQYINNFIGLENQKFTLEEADIALYNYTKVAKMCLQNIQILSKLAIKTIELHPELNTTTCFSLIPSIFGNLLTKEDTDKFHEFSKMLFTTAPGVAPRFIAFAFMTPPVLDFIKSLFEEIDVSMNDIENFVDYFKESWKENAYLVPQYIIDIVSDSNYPENHIYDLLIKPILVHSKFFGLTKPCEVIDNSIISEILKQLDSYKHELWDQIKNSPTHCSLPQSIKILTDMHKTFYTFLNEDLTVLSKFSKIAKENGYFSIDVPQYQGPHKILFFTDTDFVERTTPNQSFSEFWSNQEDLELEVRTLLINCPFIQKSFSNCPEKNFFNELLKVRTLAARDKQLKLELNIKRVQKQVGDKFDFRLLLDLLQKGLRDRTIEHKNKLNQLAQYHTTFDTILEMSNKNANLIKKKILIIRYFMIVEWQKEEGNKLSKQMEDNQIKLLNSQDQFYNFFEDVSQSWQQWLKKRNYNLWDYTLIIHSYLLEKFPLSLYQEKHPELVHEDEIIASLISEEREEMIDIFKDKFINNFIERPELLTDMIILLKKALNAQEPTIAAKLLGRVFHEMAFITQTEIKEDAGENEFTPLRLYIFILAEPEHLISYLSYLSHFLYPLFNIQKYMEIITISDALIGHFREIIKKLRPTPVHTEALHDNRKSLRLGRAMSKADLDITNIESSIKRSSSYSVLVELDQVNDGDDQNNI